MKRKINNHQLMKSWGKFAKKQEGCIQCQHPWYDGICNCNFSKIHQTIVSEIKTLAHEIISDNENHWEY